MRGAGHYACLVAEEQPLDMARCALSAAVRASSPGPWLRGDAGLGVSCGAVENAIARGAGSPDAIGSETCALLRAARLRQAA